MLQLMIKISNKSTLDCWPSLLPLVRKCAAQESCVDLMSEEVLHVHTEYL